MVFNTAQSVGEIVAAFPGASNLFKAHGIDFCCGGARRLGEALQARGIPAESFLTELDNAYNAAQARQAVAGVDWRTAAFGALINRIVNRHHAYLKQELPLLSGFVRKICHVHGAHHPELAALNRQFHALKAELEPHMVAEEDEFFPLVAAYERSRDPSDLARVVAALDELEAEHQAAGGLLAQMRESTAGYRLPEDACRTYTLTYQKLSELEADMFEHVHLENNVLFPRLRQAATAP